MLAPITAYHPGDFGTVAGSIVGGQIAMTGNATGTVAGRVIGMQDLTMTPRKIRHHHAARETRSTRTGLSFGNYYRRTQVPIGFAP